MERESDLSTVQETLDKTERGQSRLASAVKTLDGRDRHEYDASREEQPG